MTKQLYTWCHGLGIDNDTYYDMNEGVSKLFKIQSLNLYHYTDSDFVTTLETRFSFRAFFERHTRSILGTKKKWWRNLPSNEKNSLKYSFPGGFPQIPTHSE